MEDPDRDEQAGEQPAHAAEAVGSEPHLSAPQIPADRSARLVALARLGEAAARRNEILTQHMQAPAPADAPPPSDPPPRTPLLPAGGMRMNPAAPPFVPRSDFPEAHLHQQAATNAMQQPAPGPSQWNQPPPQYRAPTEQNPYPQYANNR